MATVLVVMLASCWWLVRLLDARTQERAMVQQTLQADLWARMLSARMEAHQRLLSSIAQGVHTSLLDKPEVLDALMQQDGSMLRLFDSLHVALPSGSVTHHGAVGKTATIELSGRDALRRTLSEGKPTVSLVRAEEDAQHLRVLLTVPIRQATGAVSGVLAAVVKLPLAALLPEPTPPESGVQYMLLDSDGLVLAHSDAAKRWQNIQSLVAPHGAQWQLLSQPSTANADTQMWGDIMATRVGLPLPQWQAVVLRDTRADLIWHQPLPVWIWLGLATGVLALLGIAGAALSQYLRGPYWRADAATGAVAQSDTQNMPALGDLAAASADAQQPPAQAQARAMFEAVSAAMLLENDGAVTLATPQVGVLLGYFGGDLQQLSWGEAFETPECFARVRQALAAVGSFEGTLCLRKKDGDTAQIHALAWTPSQLPAATVWRLQVPWVQARPMPLPDVQQAWRDPLTRLPNREAFMWGLQSWVSDSILMYRAESAAAQPRMPMQGCLLFVDVDHLGQLNEVTSREMGNQILRHVARILASYTEPLGRVARLGGDEFAVLLPGVSLVHAQGIGQALCDAVWRWQPSWQGERHWVTISVGVVSVDAQRHTPQQALRAADMACYEAKRRGRCQVAMGQISTQPRQEV